MSSLPLIDKLRSAKPDLTGLERGNELIEKLFDVALAAADYQAAHGGARLITTAEKKHVYLQAAQTLEKALEPFR